MWTSALARAGVEPRDVDLYVQRSAELNAYAAGGRSVALTTAVVSKFLARRLGSAPMEAILVHDLLTAPSSGMRSMPLRSAA